VTYFGLRKYSGGEEIWDGNPACQHKWGADQPCHHLGQVEQSKWKDAVASDYGQTQPSGNFCQLCGAWKGQLGNEPTPELYLRHLVEICREVRRVLRPDGVFWLNIGDSWSGSGGAHKPEHANPGMSRSSARSGVPLNGVNYNGCKPLDMVLIPEQLALAFRADSWYLRSVLIWAKGVSLSDEFNGNPMPESVNGWRWTRHQVKVGNNGRGREAWRVGANNTPQQDHDKDGNFKSSAVWQNCPGCPKCEKHNGYILRKGSWRPTDSYECVLMLTKTGSYFCDREAVLEPIAPSTIGRGKVSFGGEKGRNYNPDESDPNFRNGSEQWGREYDYTKSNGNGGRNLRSVLMIPTTGFKGAHFAVFPPRLVEPLVKAATSEKGCCPKCGSPWARVIQKPEAPHDGETDCKNIDIQGNTRRLAVLRQAARESGSEYANQSSTIGWLPTCECQPVLEPIPCRVLDPFSGAGTTSLVCERLGLDSIGIDTSVEYIKLAEARIVEDEQKRIGDQIKQLKEEAKLEFKTD